DHGQVPRRQHPAQAGGVSTGRGGLRGEQAGRHLTGSGDRVCADNGRVTMSADTVMVRLAYGEDGMEVDLPRGRTTVVEPMYADAAEDQRGLLREALRRPVHGPPLRDLVRPGQ